MRQAYEVLSNPEKRWGYNQRLHTSSTSGSGRLHAGGGARTGREAATTVDFSDLLRNRAGRSDRPQETNRTLHEEDVVRLLARVLGVHISRTSELLGKDAACLSRLVGDNIRMSAKVSVGDVWMRRATGQKPASKENKEKFRPGNRTKEGSRKVTRTQGERKRVQGLKARRTGD